MTVRPWFLIFALWLALCVVLIANVFHYATAFYGPLP